MFTNKEFNGDVDDSSQYDLLCDLCGERLGAHFGRECNIADEKENSPIAKSNNKYQRTVPSTTIDIYDVLTAWEVSNPAVQHAIKKLLQPGQRGHKTREQDLREALVSIERAIELEAK